MIIFNLFTQFPTLNNSLISKNPYNFPDYMELWEIILNQNFTEKYLEEETKKADDIVELISDLLQTLYTSNSLYICDPKTGEIIYHCTQNGTTEISTEFLQNLKYQ